MPDHHHAVLDVHQHDVNQHDDHNGGNGYVHSHGSRSAVR